MLVGHSRSLLLFFRLEIAHFLFHSKTMDQIPTSNLHINVENTHLLELWDVFVELSCHHYHVSWLPCHHYKKFILLNLLKYLNSLKKIQIHICPQYMVAFHIYSMWYPLKKHTSLFETLRQRKTSTGLSTHTRAGRKRNTTLKYRPWFPAISILDIQRNGQ